MGERKKVAAVIGTYRKGGIIDTAVDEILSAAAEEGAEVSKIYLTDVRIEFCTNCRICAGQTGLERGRCPIPDEMGKVLDIIERSNAVVLASPMNFWTVTAVTKRFVERLVCYAYWPWGMAAPRTRNREMPRRAVVVSSSAAPAVLARPATRIVGLLKSAASLLGARTVGVLFIGMAARRERQDIGWWARRKARRLGRRLAAGSR